MRLAGVSSTTEYHQRLVAILTRLAQTTRDPDTASALMRLAAEHTAQAEHAAEENRKPDQERS